MKKEELHSNFLKEFEELLKKYDAEFNMDFCIRDGIDKPMVMFNENHDDKLNIREYSELKLPSYIS